MGDFMYNYRKDDNKQVTAMAKFILKKDCACHSIREIECFLHSLNKLFRVKHLYKFLK